MPTVNAQLSQIEIDWLNAQRSYQATEERWFRESATASRALEARKALQEAGGAFADATEALQEETLKR